VHENAGVFSFKKGEIAKQNFYKKIVYTRTMPKGVNPALPITVLIPLHYSQANNYLNLAGRNMLSKEGRIMAFGNSTYLLVHDLPANIERVFDVVNFLDRPFLANKLFRIMHLENIESTAFIRRLRELLRVSSIPNPKSIKENGVVLTDLPELNAIFIVSDKQEWLDYILNWKTRFDQEAFFSEESKLFVYKPKFREANEIVKLINQTQSIASLSKSQNRKQTKKTKLSPTLSKGQTNEKLHLISDEQRNLIIIRATQSEYKQFLTTIKRLDIMPKQVLIEVMIAELTLTDSLKYGLEWYLKNESASSFSEIKTLGGLGLGGQGLAFSHVSSGGDFSTLFNLFAKKQQINILSSPKLMVLDGESASINVGTKIPIISSEATSVNLEATNNNQQTIRNVQYQNTGVTTKITPTIYSNGMLKLNIQQVLSDAQKNSTSSIDSPIILNRSLQTQVVLNNGEEIILGGLISDNQDETETKVPFFGDIPIVGQLFKSTSLSNTKTELVMAVRPYIIENSEESYALMSALRKSFIGINW